MSSGLMDQIYSIDLGGFCKSLKMFSFVKTARVLVDSARTWAHKIPGIIGSRGKYGLFRLVENPTMKPRAMYALQQTQRCYTIISPRSVLVGISFVYNRDAYRTGFLI